MPAEFSSWGLVAVLQKGNCRQFHEAGAAKQAPEESTFIIIVTPMQLTFKQTTSTEKNMCPDALLHWMIKADRNPAFPSFSNKYRIIAVIVLHVPSNASTGWLLILIGTFQVYLLDRSAIAFITSGKPGEIWLSFEV